MTSIDPARRSVWEAAVAGTSKATAKAAAESQRGTPAFVVKILISELIMLINDVFRYYDWYVQGVVGLCLLLVCHGKAKSIVCHGLEIAIRGIADKVTVKVLLGNFPAELRKGGEGLSKDFLL